MAVVSKRVAAHVIRKPVVEAIPEAVPEMQAAHETTRVDMRELQHILTSSVPVDLETDIEVCAESSEPAAVVARSTRLAHTVRRAESQAEPATPGTTVEMQAMQIEAAHAAAEPDPVPVAQIEPPRRRVRTTYYAAAAFVVAAISLVAVVASM
jgi:hypothetical protein